MKTIFLQKTKNKSLALCQGQGTKIVEDSVEYFCTYNVYLAR